MLLLYQIVISILLIFSPIIFLLRIFKNKEDKKRFVEKFSINTKKRSRGKLIWFHGASVGEILSIIPLIKNYENKKSINQILITSSTLSSAKIIKKFKFKKTIHQFYPIDHFFFTDKFLKYWKPSLAIFIESEIWPCMFNLIKKNKIPLILLNARLTRKTFNRWMKIKDFSKSIFKKITIAYPQNFETNHYLKKIKVNKIKIIGNLKFTENDEEDQKYFDKKIEIKFKKKKVWVASSTHGIEEIFCAKTHLELKKRIKNLITIIIPRHVHRSKEIISDLEKLSLKVVTHSSNIRSLKNTDIYVVDTFGETKKFHKIASSVFLGGSIVKRGGQNPLEAARYGARILHGPNIDNFKDIYKLLKTLRVSKKITTPKELANLISFKNNKKIGIKINKIGAKILKKTIKEFDSLINDEFKKT
tara:strand:+ start:201 stop:1451 length:1251 start_codon:yes stop_codon:yes gene_type:complete